MELAWLNHTDSPKIKIWKIGVDVQNWQYCLEVSDFKILMQSVLIFTRPSKFKNQAAQEQKTV